MAFWNMIKNIVITDVIAKMTKGLREEIREFVIKMDKKVKKTKNPYDDLLWKEIKDIFGIKTK